MQQIRFLDSKYPVNTAIEYKKKGTAELRQHKKRLALARNEARMRAEGFVRAAIPYEPDWLAYSRWCCDPLHYCNRSICHMCDYFCSKLIQWYKNELNGRCVTGIVAIYRSELSVRSGFSKQWIASLESGTKSQTNATGPILTRVLKTVFVDGIAFAIKYEENVHRLLILVFLFEICENIHQLHGLIQKHTFEEGVNSTEYKLYQKLSIRRYKMILQLVKEYNLPYEHYHYYVMRHKMCYLLRTHPKHRGINLGSTSAQEHAQKKDKDYTKNNANYDNDECCRFCGLADCAYGMDYILITKEDLTKRKERNLKNVISKYDADDKLKYERLASEFKPKAKRIHALIKNHNFDELITGELKRLTR